MNKTTQLKDEIKKLEDFKLHKHKTIYIDDEDIYVDNFELSSDCTKCLELQEKKAELNGRQDALREELEFLEKMMKIKMIETITAVPCEITKRISQIMEELK